MEQQGLSQEAYDFRRHDRIWQRVSPGMEAYPGLGKESAVSAELRLPGAAQDPCCLGTVAAESLPVLEGFLLEEQQTLSWERALLRRAPGSGSRALLEQLIKGSEGILRRLSAVSFLIEGYWPEKAGSFSGARPCRFSEGLRTAYHLEICGAQNYERAAEGTTDACLSRILQQFAQEKYARAERVLKLLSEICR